MMEVRVVETPATFLKNNDNTFPEINAKVLHIYPISTYDLDMAEKNPIVAKLNVGWIIVGINQNKAKN